MRTPVYCAIQLPRYWNGWALSACMHTVVVGAALFLSHQLPTPQKAERNPIAVAFVTPQLTRTLPTHRPTMEKSPPAPTAKPKQVQPEVIPREPTRSRPLTRAETKQTISPQTIAQPSPKPTLQPKIRVTNVAQLPVSQPKTVRRTQTTFRPTVTDGKVLSQPTSQPVTQTLVAHPTTVPQTASQPLVRYGTISSQPVPRHTGVARQRTADKVHASPSRKQSIRVNATIDKVDPVSPRNPIIRNHVTNAPKPIAPPVRSAPPRQSVSTLPSHEEKRTRAPVMEAMTRHVTRGQSHSTVKHVFSKAARQRTSLLSGSHAVRKRTTVNYASQTRKARPTPTSRSASTGGFSPELLAFSKLLRERIAQTLEFPRLAKRLGYSGTTHVAIALSKTGIVRDLKVSQPSGYEILDKAAIVTLQKVLQTTKPPESIEIEQLVVPITFDLKRS